MEQLYDIEAKSAQLEQAFSPSSPIQAEDFFFGRIDQINEVVDSINERGQHVIVYGERGVGKTSFANIIGSKLRGVFPVKVTCNRSDSFKGIWEKAFSKVRFERAKNGIGFLPNEKVENYQLDFFLPDTEVISALDIQYILENVDINLLFIFDEYDSVADPEILGRMADTLKSLSDNAPKITVMLVGIAQDVVDLVGAHPSNERCLRQVKIPVMSDYEIADIVDSGASFLNFRIVRQVREQIVRMSMGFPYFAHLLAKQSCKAVIEDQRNGVEVEHYLRGLRVALLRVDETIRSAYQRATFAVNDKSNFEIVLWACSNARLDDRNTFTTKDVADQFSIIARRMVTPQSLSRNIGKLCLPERNAVLERIEAGSNVRFRFKNPLFKVFVNMKYESVANRDISKIRNS